MLWLTRRWRARRDSNAPMPVGPPSERDLCSTEPVSWLGCRLLPGGSDAHCCQIVTVDRDDSIRCAWSRVTFRTSSLRRDTSQARR